MRTKISVISILISLFVGGAVGWWFGNESGFERALNQQKTVMIVGLVALEELRNQEVEKGIETLEKIVFGTSAYLLDDDVRNLGWVVEGGADKLREYRKRYRSDASSWTATEVELEELLNAIN